RSFAAATHGIDAPDTTAGCASAISREALGWARRRPCRPSDRQKERGGERSPPLFRSRISAGTMPASSAPPRKTMIESLSECFVGPLDLEHDATTEDMGMQ